MSSNLNVTHARTTWNEVIEYMFVTWVERWGDTSPYSLKSAVGVNIIDSFLIIRLWHLLPCGQYQIFLSLKIYSKIHVWHEHMHHEILQVLDVIKLTVSSTRFPSKAMLRQQVSQQSRILSLNNFIHTRETKFYRTQNGTKHWHRHKYVNNEITFAGAAASSICFRQQDRCKRW